MLPNTKLQRATTQRISQRKKLINFILKKYKLRYPGFLKLIIILDLVPICIIQVKEIKSCKLITWPNLNVSSFLVDI